MLRRLPLEITQWYTYLDEERRWNWALVEALVRSHLLHLPDFDAQLAKALQANPFGPPSELAVHLLRTCILSQEPVATAGELAYTLDVISKIASRSSSGTAILQLVERAKQVCVRVSECERRGTGEMMLVLSAWICIFVSCMRYPN
jgi:hypothetical protein